MQQQQRTSEHSRSLTLQLQRKLASRKPHIVTFTKADGTLRTMHAQYEGATIRNGVMTVRDLEINEIRSITLSRVHTVWTVTPKAAAPKPVEEMSMAELQATCDELFY